MYCHGKNDNLEWCNNCPKWNCCLHMYKLACLIKNFSWWMVRLCIMFTYFFLIHMFYMYCILVLLIIRYLKLLWEISPFGMQKVSSKLYHRTLPHPCLVRFAPGFKDYYITYFFAVLAFIFFKKGVFKRSLNWKNSLDQKDTYVWTCIH